RCSVTRLTFAARRRGAAVSACTSRITSKCPRTWRKRLSAERTAISRASRIARNRDQNATLLRSGERHGEGEIQAKQAALERGDDWAHRPRENDVDGGDHQGVVEEQPEGIVSGV